jgi:hypothetical protein
MAGIKRRYQQRRTLALAGAASYEFSEAGRYNRQSFFESSPNLVASPCYLIPTRCLGYLASRDKASDASETVWVVASEMSW